MWEAMRELQMAESLESPMPEECRQRAESLLLKARLPNLGKQELETAIRSVEDLQMSSRQLTTILQDSRS